MTKDGAEAATWEREQLGPIMTSISTQETRGQRLPTAEDIMAESGERETGSNAGWIVIGVLGLVALLVIGFFALDVFIGRQ